VGEDQLDDHAGPQDQPGVADRIEPGALAQPFGLQGEGDDCHDIIISVLPRQKKTGPARKSGASPVIAAEQTPPQGNAITAA
jgi:hypothetical protein